MKNKRGFWPMQIIVGILAALLAGWAILWAVTGSAGKADEKVQVDLCRVSNEIRMGVKESSSGWVSTPRACATIDKYTEEKFQIPTKKYPQNKEGAEAEIRDMIKNCWYMWLEGSQENAFDGLNIIGSEGCHVCYIARVKDKIVGDITFNSISRSMGQPYFVADASNKCAPEGGFLSSVPCEDYSRFGTLDKGKWKKVISKDADNSGQVCCIRKDVPNECENKGGLCSETGPSAEYKNLYYQWYCQKAKQRCYVKDDNMYTYTKYITQYGKRGGDVFFVDPGYNLAYDPDTNEISGIANPDGSIQYTNGDFAISFISPTKAGNKFLFYFGSGVLGTIGLIAGIAIAPQIVIPGILIAGAGAYVVSELELGDEIFNTLTDPISGGVANYLVVSSLKDAQKMGCSIT